MSQAQVVMTLFLYLKAALVDFDTPQLGDTQLSSQVDGNRIPRRKG